MISYRSVFSLTLLFVLIIRFGSHTLGQSPQEQLAQLVAQLRVKPDDNALREQLIKLANETKPPPAIPEEARQHFVEGSTLAKSAKDTAGQKLAVDSFNETLRIAPWWGDAYYNLAVAQELAGQFDAAQRSLKFYILTNPGEKEARDAQDRIYALGAKKKLAEAEAAGAEQKRVDEERQRIAREKSEQQSMLRSLDGAVFSHSFLMPSGTRVEDRLTVQGSQATYAYQLVGDKATWQPLMQCTMEGLYCLFPTKTTNGFGISVQISSDGRTADVRKIMEDGRTWGVTTFKRER